MASRQDDNQFDDAMEEAESDLLTSKGILSQDSGYLNDIDAPSLTRTNGELPESENAESDCGGEITEEVNGGDDVMNNYSEDHYPEDRHELDDDYQVDYNGHRANGYADDDQRYTHEEVTESDRIYENNPQLDDEHEEPYQDEHSRSEMVESHHVAEEDYTPEEYDTNVGGRVDGEMMIESEVVQNNNTNPEQEYYNDNIEEEGDEQRYTNNQVEYTESDLPDSQVVSNADSSEAQGADIEYNPAAQDDFEEEDSYQDEPDQWMECDSVELTTPGANPTHIEEGVGLNQTRETELGENDSVEADQEEPPTSEAKGFLDHIEPNVMEIKSEPVVIEKPPVLDQDDLIDSDDKFNDDTEDKFIDVDDINDINEPDIPIHMDQFKAKVPDANSFKPISLPYETTKSEPDRTQSGERKEMMRMSPDSPPRHSPTMPTRREQQISPNNNTAVPMQKNTTMTIPSSQAQRKVIRQAPGAATRTPPVQAQSQSPRSQQPPLGGERRVLSQNPPLSSNPPAQNTDRSPVPKSERRQDAEQGMMGMKPKADIGGNGAQRSMKPAPGSAKPVAAIGNANPVASLKSRLQSERQAMLELEKTLAVTAQQNNVQQQARRTQNAPRRPAAGGSSEPLKTSPVSARHNDEYASVSSLRRGQENRQDNRRGQDTNHRPSPVTSPTGNNSQAIPQQVNRSPRPPSQRSSPEEGRTPAKPSTSPVRRVTGQGRPQQQQIRQEQPRNNSNANHLPGGGRLDHSKSNSIQSALTQGNSATNNRSYAAYDVTETLSNASGEVLFDDCAECGAYLEDKIMSYQDEPTAGQVLVEKYATHGGGGKEYRAPSSNKLGPRRRRNSYELANRMSSSEEEEDDMNGLFTPQSQLTQHRKEDLSSLIAATTNGGKYENVDNKVNDDRPAIPSTGVDDNLLAKLAERELANLWKSHERLKPSESTDSGIRQDSSRQSTASDYSSPPMTPGEHNNRPEPRKVLPNISPMEYDVIGLRLAGHSATINENNMNLTGNPPQPEEDQFSDAEENDTGATSSSNPNGSSDQYVDGNSTYSGSSLDYGTETPDSGTYSGRNMPRSSNHDQGPQVNIKETMKELQDALSTSKSALMKTPSFYVQEAPPEPVWILQPHTVKKMAEDARKARITEERKKRQDELRQIRQQQRSEILQNTNPQCYQREEDDDEDGLENRQLMSDRDGPGSPAYNRHNRSGEPDTMRAPDLPPATGKIKEARGPHDETALSKGILYPAAYLGSTQLVTTKQPTKKVRMQQAQEAVNRIKSPDGEDQPSTEVDLAISNERIRVLNADTQETMMDHPLKSISYIADIGNIVVIMARRRTVTRTLDEAVEDSGVSMDAEGRRQPRKIICHVFETEDDGALNIVNTVLKADIHSNRHCTAQLIAQTIGQAFALAYLEFLKANGIEDPHVFEMDYHDVLNSQEIYGDDLMLFSNKECEKEVLVEKERGEIMGMVIVESGWGSLVPTVVIANMSPFGAAARSGKLNIGDQIMSINGTSLVGLPLAQCQQIIKSLKSQCLVKFNMVSCPPVTQVLIKRPDTKYQLGFSVQNGIICSLMRGGIAERGGVRVGHRIIEINGTSVVATAHEKIVEMLSTSIGEIRMKTMPLSMYKLLTGQEQPVYI